MHMNAEVTAVEKAIPPGTREECRVRIGKLRDDIAAIKTQIAAADLDRQARGGRFDARWFHRAKTALRHKQREIEAVAARMAALPVERPDSFQDCLLEVVREDYDDEEWSAVLSEARERQAERRGS